MRGSDDELFPAATWAWAGAGGVEGAQALDLSELQIHVGLNTGRVAAGNIGSEHYLRYATVGDATNVAVQVKGQQAPLTLYRVDWSATAPR